jgi:hypothetical protein
MIFHLKGKIMTIDQTEIDFQEKCSQLVSREVYYCVSSLISHLMEKEPDNEDLLSLGMSYDYESAATEEGWEVKQVGDRYLVVNSEGNSVYEPIGEDTESFDEDEFEEEEEMTFEKWLTSLEDDYFFDDESDVDSEVWQKLCQAEHIDPHEREVLEHWLVSNWLAEKLQANDEIVVDDLYGLTVWGRTTSGQAISMDGVIRQIVRNLYAQ